MRRCDGNVPADDGLSARIRWRLCRQQPAVLLPLSGALGKSIPCLLCEHFNDVGRHEVVLGRGVDHDEFHHALNDLLGVHLVGRDDVLHHEAYVVVWRVDGAVSARIDLPMASRACLVIE